MSVVGAVQLGLADPRHLEIIASDQLLRVEQPRIACERRIAAEVTQVTVFPEDAQRGCVDDGAHQVLRLTEFLEKMIE